MALYCKRKKKKGLSRAKFNEQFICAEAIHDAFQALSPSGVSTKFISVKAPVKSGKKIIKQAMLEPGLKIPDADYFFVSSLARKASAPQLVELAESGYNIVRPSVPIAKDSQIPKDKRFSVEDLIYHILANPGRQIFIIWDECDYGSDKESKSAQLLSFLARQYAENVKVAFFSATPQEVDGSKLADRPDFKEIRFYPSKDYTGAKWFLDKGFYYDLGLSQCFTHSGEGAIISPTGHAFLDEFEQSEESKTVAVVRLSQKKKYKHFQDQCDNGEGYLAQFESRDISVLTIDQNSPDEERMVLSDRAALDKFLKNHRIKKLLIVLCHTFSRSAELDIHDRMHSWFEQRNSNGKRKSNFAAEIQSIGRTFGYHDKNYGIGAVNIKLWVPK